MGKITVENIKVFAHHGCLSEETRIGSDYLVTLAVHGDLSKASVSDSLEHTLDYVHINQIVKEEMGLPSKLLEHVAQRILDRVFKELPSAQKVMVQVSKVNPPINGDVEKVTVRLKLKRTLE